MEVPVGGWGIMPTWCVQIVLPSAALVCFSGCERLARSIRAVQHWWHDLAPRTCHLVTFWKPCCGVFCQDWGLSCSGIWNCCFLFLQVKMIGMELGPPSRPPQLGQWRGHTESTHTDAIKAVMRGKYHFWANSCFWFLYLPGFLLLYPHQTSNCLPDFSLAPFFSYLHPPHPHPTIDPAFWLLYVVF